MRARNLATITPGSMLIELEEAEEPPGVIKTTTQRHDTAVRHASMLNVGAAVGKKSMCAVVIICQHVDAGDERSSHFFYRRVRELSQLGFDLCVTHVPCEDKNLTRVYWT